MNEPRPPQRRHHERLSDRDHREQARAGLVRELRDRICAEFERLEDELTGTSPTGRPAASSARPGTAPDPEAGDGGGGDMSIMRGRVFEKVGVNISTVHGDLRPEFASPIPGAAEDPRFWASGISSVAHMQNPPLCRPST